MDNHTRLQRWLAVVRVATGGVFVYMGTGHLLGGLATADGFQKLIAGFAKTDPIQPYTSVMVPILLSAPAVFGPLFVFGMLAAGLGLLVGLFTRIALFGAVWLSLNNLLMGFGAGGVHHSTNILMLTIELGFLWTGAWRRIRLILCFSPVGLRAPGGTLRSARAAEPSSGTRSRSRVITSSATLRGSGSNRVELLACRSRNHVRQPDARRWRASLMGTVIFARQSTDKALTAESLA